MTDEKKDQREEQDSSEFKVDDRRLFTSEGNLREDESSSEGQKREDESSTGDQKKSSQAGSPEQDKGPQDSPSESSSVSSSTSTGDTEAPVDFSSFLISLATTALVHLGEIPDPATGEASENLEAGKQMIEIIAILKEKTSGNLDDDESRLLDELLYELRMKYLARARVISG